jgi:hypothetical protein
VLAEGQGAVEVYMEPATISLIRALRTADPVAALNALDETDAELDEQTVTKRDIPPGSVRSPSGLILRDAS